MQANFIYYNPTKKLLVLLDKNAKPFYAVSGELIEAFYNRTEPENPFYNRLNIHTYSTLSDKINELNTWLNRKSKLKCFNKNYVLKTHHRDYYVSKLMELSKSNLTVIRA